MKARESRGGFNNSPCTLLQIVKICTGRPYPGPEVQTLTSPPYILF